MDALGLNFRDVLIALDKYPDKDTQLGIEFAGRIINPNCGRTANETRVFGVMPDSFADEVVLPRSAISTYPEHLSPTVAAGLPVAYLTAWRGLVEVANLRPDQTVLVHNGSGGVGMAAIHLSRRIGARVISTAGTAEKRAYVRSLGVESVFGSRDGEFVDQVIKITGGKGADVVIGALPPSLAAANLQAISETGCFVDMGKLWVPEAQEVCELRPKMRYSSMRLDTDALRNPDWVGRTLEMLSREIAADALPILPVSEFCVREADKAFRFMAKAQHRGKVVLKFPNPIN